MPKPMPVPGTPEYWEEGGRIWVEEERNHDALLEPFGELVLDAAELTAGQAVLDVGCGTAQMTIAAARRVAPSGRVVGVDISTPLVERARERAAEAGADNVEIAHGDAATLPIDAGSFDAVVSRFGVMFFGDPVAAFSNLRRAMRDGGRLAFSAWQAVTLSPAFMLPASVLRRHAEVPDPPPPNAPGQFGFADAGFVNEVLSKAGFADVEIRPDVREVRAGAGRTLEDAVHHYASQNIVQLVFADADEATVEAYRADLADTLAPHLTEDGVRLPAAAWIVTARR